MKNFHDLRRVPRQDNQRLSCQRAYRHYFDVHARRRCPHHWQHDFLFVFGDNIEDRYGRIKYILNIHRMGSSGNPCSQRFALSAGQGEFLAVGASGAISGILGAYLVMYPRAKIFTVIAVFFLYTVRIPVLIYIPFWFILQVIFTRNRQRPAGASLT